MTRVAIAPILRDYESGVSLPEIARRHGISIPTIYNRLRSREIALRGQAYRRRADHAAVIADYESGMTLRAVGEKHGVTHVAVLRILKRSGVPVRPRNQGAAA